MAKTTVLVCDLNDPDCAGDAVTWRFWRDGDKQATEVDLCTTHGGLVSRCIDAGRVVDLPTKQRVRMEVTPLKATARTKPLKKE